MKYSLPSGEVIELDIDDVLEIDFTTTKGKEVMQEIIFISGYVKHYVDFDDADFNDSLKFMDKDEDNILQSLEEFEEELFKQSLKDITES